MYLNRTRIYNHEASESLVKQTAKDVAESVLKGFNGNTGTNINVTQNILTTQATPSEIARQTKNNLKELALGW